MTQPAEDPPPAPVPDRMLRRAMLKLSAAGILGVTCGAGAAAGITRWTRTSAPKYRFFTDGEATLLIAICEQIIPRDDAPGATDAGVIDYIDRQLCGSFVRHRQVYRLCLEAFRKSCLEVYQLPFEQLPFDRQTEALRMIESGKAPAKHWGGQSQWEFFSLLVDHTRQGFYGSPRHGGNRDYASYRMLGLAYPNLIGQNRYHSRPSS